MLRCPLKIEEDQTRTRQSSNDNVDELSVLVAAAYRSHSSNIVDVLNDFLEKAQTELGDTRHSWSNAAHNFEMLKQSFEDQLTQLDTDLDKANANEAEFTTSLEVGEVDLWRLSCAQVAFDHVASVKAFAARQERAHCRARSAHFAHIRKHDVWCWDWRGALRKGEGFGHGLHQEVAGRGLVCSERGGGVEGLGRCNEGGSPRRSTLPRSSSSLCASLNFEVGA